MFGSHLCLGVMIGQLNLDLGVFGTLLFAFGSEPFLLLFFLGFHTLRLDFFDLVLLIASSSNRFSGVIIVCNYMAGVAE